MASKKFLDIRFQQWELNEKALKEAYGEQKLYVIEDVRVFPSISAYTLERSAGKELSECVRLNQYNQESYMVIDDVVDTNWEDAVKEALRFVSGRVAEQHEGVGYFAGWNTGHEWRKGDGKDRCMQVWYELHRVGGVPYGRYKLITECKPDDRRVSHWLTHYW